MSKKEPEEPLIDPQDRAYLDGWVDRRRIEQEQLAVAARLDPTTAIGRAWQCAQCLPGPFTLGDLVVACWQSAPTLFGLKGSPHYPCSHRVRCCLYGPRGLLGRGLVRKEGADRFAVRLKQRLPVTPWDD